MPEIEDLVREIDLLRARYHELSSSVTALELTTVKREGPFMDRLHDLEQRVDRLATREDIKDALAKRTLGIGAKVYGVLITLILLALTLYEAVTRTP